jgi:hypothetical protein
MQVQTQKQIKILQTEAKNVANKLNKEVVVCLCPNLKIGNVSIVSFFDISIDKATVVLIFF